MMRTTRQVAQHQLDWTPVLATAQNSPLRLLFHGLAWAVAATNGPLIVKLETCA